jgi:hypothetical protein
MPEASLDLARPFFLIKILDKDSGNDKFIWSPNIFMDDERPEDASKISPGTYIEDIDVKSNYDPPVNIGEVKINHNVGATPAIAINDILQIYFGYYTKGENPNTAVYSLAYSGNIGNITASLNYTIIRASSVVKKIAEAKRDLVFSRAMTITEIIQKLAIDDAGLEAAQSGISDTSVQKQSGFGISKKKSVFEHIKKLAGNVDFDVYMDPFDKFNARLWTPEDAPAATDSSGGDVAIAWISARDESETGVQSQLTHKLYFGVNTLDFELDVKGRGPSNVQITTLADSQENEAQTIDPPTGDSASGGEGGGESTSSSSSSGESTEAPERIMMPRVTKEHADTIAQTIVRQGNMKLGGKITILGAPQIRLGDGIKIFGHIYGKKPLSYLDSEATEYDASYTTEEETQDQSESGSSSTEETMFKVTGIKHLFNDKLGFISKLTVKEDEPATTAAEEGTEGAEAEEGEAAEGEGTEFAGEADETMEPETAEEETEANLIDYEVTVALDMDDPDAQEDKVSLISTDGKFIKSLSIGKDGKKADEGYTTLLFREVPAGKLYNIEVDTGETKYFLIKGIEIQEEEGAEGTESTEGED